ncbi:VWA domain-containing protein [Streptomyces sp. GESEQ-4]|uniref:vWA domain-containing protein n=1 Tax=Streptomyces sp. GESEQ-4 TaxID=2812655 RepID=UPI0027DBBBAE|nr:VWA domain-containing protein [Streptomyces sp. GESEQ-4]
MSPSKNRALLVGVSTYEDKKPPHGVPGDLPAVEHNLNMLRRALLKGGVFDDDSITVCRSPSQGKFNEALYSAAAETDGLLLLYFAGHGATPSSGVPLFLQMRDARVIRGGHTVFPGAAKYDDVQTVLLSSKAERIVVVLDCCYAGNAGVAWEREHEYSKRRVLLLMSVQANHRIDAGDPATPTPFTAELVRLLEKPGEWRFRWLSGQLREEMARQKTMRGEPWVPQSRAEPGEDVLLSARPESGAVQPPRTEEPAHLSPRPSPLLKHLRHRAAALGTLVLTLAAFAFGTYGLVSLVGSSPVCAPPLELRVLTDPDLKPTVTSAANTYLTSEENTDGDGCRVSGITVYSARSADVVTALREESEPWQEPRAEETNPQRDIGPQADIWIPGSPAAAQRAEHERDTNPKASLKVEGQPFAYSPVVLAVPTTLPAADQRTDRKLAELIADLRGRADQAEVRRSDPEFTDSALFATIGLYDDADRALDVEKQLDQPGPPSDTAAQLLCELPRDDAVDDRTAVLVPEFLLKSGVGCDSWRRSPRIAEYPTNVPGLEPTFVRVRWQDGDLDRDARDAAVADFRSWLTDGQGRDAFARAGFRAATGRRPLLDGSGPAPGVLPDPKPLTEAAGRNETEAALRAYRAAHGPGRVLFLLDSSGSMASLWDGPSGGPGLLKQSLGGLGGQDEYGVRAVADTPEGDRYVPLLPLATHDREDAVRTIDQAEVRSGADSDPHAALLGALDDMADQGTDDRPQLIVYITDSGDHDRMTGGKLDEVLTRAKSAGVPVAMVSLRGGACGAGKPDARIAAASGGRCLDADDDIGKGLSAEVERTGLGEDQ